MNPQRQRTRTTHGFTLIETLLVVALLAVLVSVAVYTLEPVRQFSLIRDDNRKSDVHEIMNALKRYALDHEGVLPGDLTSDLRGICRTDSGSCTGMYDLSELTNEQEYLVALPIDPLCLQDETQCGEGETGYVLGHMENGNIHIRAPLAENEDILLIR